MKASNYFILFLSIICSSCNFLITPPKRSFKYYDKNFSFNANNTLLRIDGIYVKESINQQVSKNIKLCDYLIFTEDGMVKSDNINCGLDYQKIVEYPKQDFGYYKIKKDSIFFTLKSFYDKRVIKYTGVAYKDSIVLEYFSTRTNNSGTETYKFQPDWYHPIK